ncbi:hypothetical protein CVS30_17465 [Arthrobacter psychrolactophilus]|uniref:Uncharacterized protein n=1 Tax=Arthrobacter psychrolactophilus TaxID=92442 RepID=A0A2V5J463_9MICC|nr:hypothetical protein CVS30_17465 [Arthrobacter psychrolactophilus]
MRRVDLPAGRYTQVIVKARQGQEMLNNGRPLIEVVTLVLSFDFQSDVTACGWHLSARPVGSLEAKMRRPVQSKELGSLCRKCRCRGLSSLLRMVDKNPVQSSCV